MNALTFSERLMLCEMIRRQIEAAGADPKTFDPLMTKALASNAAPDWSAFFAALVAALPQILAFIAALAPLFGA